MSSLPLKFNAGKVAYDAEADQYIPAKTPGQIIIDQSPEGEGCFSFTWKPKSSTSQDIEELLVFQGDVIWKKVNSCTSGRVYMLAFLSSGAKHLYWMQDVNDVGAGEDDSDEVLSTDSKNDIEVSSQIRTLLCDV